MNKDEAKTWMVENGFAVNEFAAEHIWENLFLDNVEEKEQKRMIEQYRKWRTVSQNTKLCFAYVLENIEFPKMYEAR